MKFKGWHLLALVSCALWLAYYPALSAPLNSVDDVRLAHDLLNRSVFSWSDFWVPGSRSYFRPLVNSSFIVDSLLWNFEPPFLHLENVLLHWLNTLLVYCLVRLVASRQDLNPRVVPAVAALMFGLHPINTEAVIWIAGRADLLATTFILSALCCAIIYFLRESICWALATSIFFLLGTLAKETALLLLPGLFVLGWLAGKERRLPDTWRIKSMYPAVGSLICVSLYAWLRSVALQGRDLGLHNVGQVVAAAAGSAAPGGSITTGSSTQLWTLLERLVSGAGFYAWKLVQPFPLNFGIVEVWSGFFWVGCLLVPLVIFLLLRLSWWSGFILTAMSLASIALLVAMRDFSWTPYAERYMYGPSAMLAAGVSIAGAQFMSGRFASAWRDRLVVIGLILSTFCGVEIFQRALLWQDNLNLFADTVRKSPGFALAHNQLAETLWERGRRDEAMEIVRNIDVPQTQVAFINKHLLLLAEGRPEEARQFLLEYLDKPQTEGYHTVILERLVDVVEQMRGETASPELKARYDDEITGYLKALWERTGRPFYLYRAGQKQMARGDLIGARESFLVAYDKFPPDSIYREPARKLAEKLAAP